MLIICGQILFFYGYDDDANGDHDGDDDGDDDDDIAFSGMFER